jgi:[ribosomal protein S5]-alanine N-acetyltransferase
MLETPRLIIRPYTLNDAIPAFALFNDSDVMEFIPGGIDHSLDDTEKRINNYINHYKTFGFGKYVLIDKFTYELIGDCGISRIENTEINELGYRIRKKYWNQGFATEAAKAVIKYAFQTLKFQDLHAIVEPQNGKSIYILENKLGFKYIGQLYCYGLTFDLYKLQFTYIGFSHRYL